MEFEIVRGNIAKISADAIVLPANTKLLEGSGASAAIFEAAGREKLTAACRSIGSCEVGKAVPTPAFSLEADYIIHAVTPVWNGGNSGEYDLLSSAYLSSLALADVMSCASIAFPLLASGNNGFDLELAFDIATNSIQLFEGQNLQKVFLVIHGDHIASIVKNKGFSLVTEPTPIRNAVSTALRNQAGPNAWGALQQFVAGQIHKGVAWLKEDENQKMLLNAGKKIALWVLGTVLEKKKSLPAPLKILGEEIIKNKK